MFVIIIAIFVAAGYVEYKYADKNYIYYANQKEIVVVQFALSLLFIIFFHNAMVKNN